MNDFEHFFFCSHDQGEAMENPNGSDTFFFETKTLQKWKWIGPTNFHPRHEFITKDGCGFRPAIQKLWESSRTKNSNSALKPSKGLLLGRFCSFVAALSSLSQKTLTPKQEIWCCRDKPWSLKTSCAARSQPTPCFAKTRVGSGLCARDLPLSCSSAWWWLVAQNLPVQIWLEQPAGKTGTRPIGWRVLPGSLCT